MLNKVSFWFVLVILAGASMVGCKVVGTVQIDVIKPADTVLPNQVNSVIVLNNYRISADDSISNSIQKAYYLLDTLTSHKIMNQLVYFLNESPRIDTCLNYPAVIYRQAKDRMKPIAPADINRITEKYQVDAVLSLEVLGIIDSMARITQFDGYSYSSYSFLSLFVSSVWRIYLPESETYLFKWFQRDTLFVSEIISLNDFRETIKTQDGLDWISDKIASQVAPKVSDKLVPYWIPVQRDFFYNQQAEMQVAANYAYRDEWLKAAAIWQKLSTHEDTWISGASCHNMALACEVAGKLELALIWEKKALEKLSNYTTRNYYRLLEYRIKEAELLNKQFGITKD
ncbi:MAG: DUF6340 family protein [Salinivirgaceae bacterium]|jgi:hypothetical protein